MKTVQVSDDAFAACQAILQGDAVDKRTRDAAIECIDAHRKGLGVDAHVAGVLAKHAGRMGQQNRWGR
jgi:hypothetical protein